MSETTTPRRTPVLLVTRELGLGGSERQLAETALALDRECWEPHVACFYPGGFRAAELADAGVPVLELGVRSMVSGSAVAAARRLGSYAAAHGIRLVHAFDVPSDLFAVPAARFYRVQAVLSSQRAHRNLIRGFERHLLRLTDRIADAIVVNSHSVARQLMDEDGVPPSMIRLAYNGLDAEVFRPEGPRAQTPWTADSIIVGVVCALRPEKGLDVLLDAFAAARDGAKLLIVGSGPALGDLEARAHALGLGGDCSFQPAVKNVAEWLRAIDVFVLPSRSEALSNSLLEAMGCGCCPMASDTGGNPELVIDGDTGLLFRSGDAAALAGQLRVALENAELRKTLAVAARLRAHREFSRERAVKRMGEIYREFVA